MSEHNQSTAEVPGYIRAGSALAVAGIGVLAFAGEAEDLLAENYALPMFEAPAVVYEVEEAVELEHIVESGQNLGEIATLFGVELELLVEHNDIINPNVVFIGQIIRIPEPEFIAAEDTEMIDQEVINEEELQQFIESIRYQESRGNYQAIGPDTKWGKAKGAYQFVDDTWKRALRAYDAELFADNPTALHASPGLQDAVALHWFTGLHRRYDGSLELMAIAHHGGEGVADEVMSGERELTTENDDLIFTSEYVEQVMSRVSLSPEA